MTQPPSGQPKPTPTCFYCGRYRCEHYSQKEWDEWERRLQGQPQPSRSVQRRLAIQQGQPQRSIEDIDADEQRELDDYRAEMEHWYGDRQGQPQQEPAERDYRNETIEFEPHYSERTPERQAGGHVHNFTYASRGYLLSIGCDCGRKVTKAEALAYAEGVRDARAQGVADAAAQAKEQ